MIKLYNVLILLICPLLIYGQSNLVNNRTNLKIGTNINLKVNNGSITNKNSGQISNDGNLYLDLNYSQNTAATYTGGASSWLWFEGAIDQNIISDAAINLTRLKIDNNNKLLFNNQLTIGTTLDLSNNGKAELGTNNLILNSGATIIGYDLDNYIVTNSTGILEQEAGASNVVFPIGNTTFNPAILNNSGTIDNFQLRVIEQVFEQGLTGSLKTSNAPNRSWIIDETVVGGSNLTLTLQWATVDEMTAFDRTNSGIAHHLSGNLWDNPASYTAATNVGINLWTQTRSGITSFSPFVVRDLNTDLPVELLHFNAVRKDADYVQLDWATETETNNKGFYIERMLEVETEFEAIVFVDGQGTTVYTTHYQNMDANSYSGVSYYRLKQVDFDGTVSYSDVKAVAGTGDKNTSYIDVIIYPNPVYDELKVRFNELPTSIKSAEVKIMSVNGKILHAFKVGVQSYQTMEIEYVKDLTPAMYMLSIELDNGEQILQKFVKQ